MTGVQKGPGVIVVEAPGCECGLVYPGLFAFVEHRWYCSTCWKKAGRPWPRFAARPIEAANQEQRTRERMLKRGGSFRHLARSGKA